MSIVELQVIVCDLWFDIYYRYFLYIYYLFFVVCSVSEFVLEDGLYLIFIEYIEGIR